MHKWGSMELAAHGRAVQNQLPVLAKANLSSSDFVQILSYCPQITLRDATATMAHRSGIINVDFNTKNCLWLIWFSTVCSLQLTAGTTEPLYSLVTSTLTVTIYFLISNFLTIFLMIVMPCSWAHLYFNYGPVVCLTQILFVFTQSSTQCPAA